MVTNYSVEEEVGQAGWQQNSREATGGDVPRTTLLFRQPSNPRYCEDPTGFPLENRAEHRRGDGLEAGSVFHEVVRLLR